MKVLFRPAALLLLAVLLGSSTLTGCGASGPAGYTVSGLVTLDGQPLPDGEVIFLPADGKGQPAAGRIADGKFTLTAPAGKKRVEIRADRDHPTKKMGGIEPGTTIPVREQYIPARYNTASELTEEVTAGGEKSPTFNLQSK